MYPHKAQTRTHNGITYSNPISLRCCPINLIISASIPPIWRCFLLLTKPSPCVPTGVVSPFSSHPFSTRMPPSPFTASTVPLPFSKTTPFEVILDFDNKILLELCWLAAAAAVLIGVEVVGWDKQEGSPISSLSTERRALFKGGGVNPPSLSLSSDARAYEGRVQGAEPASARRNSRLLVSSQIGEFHQTVHRRFCWPILTDCGVKEVLSPWQ